MNSLIIEPTAMTPEIHLEPGKPLLIAGRSIPESARDIFAPVIAWVQEYLEQGNNAPVLEFRLEYVNSGSSKYILELLRNIKAYITRGGTITLKWYYEEGDESIQDLGQHFRDSLGLPMEIIPLYE